MKVPVLEILLASVVWHATHNNVQFSILIRDLPKNLEPPRVILSRVVVFTIDRNRSSHDTHEEATLFNILFEAY